MERSLYPLSASIGLVVAVEPLMIGEVIKRAFLRFFTSPSRYARHRRWPVKSLEGALSEAAASPGSLNYLR